MHKDARNFDSVVLNAGIDKISRTILFHSFQNKCSKFYIGSIISEISSGYVHKWIAAR